MSGPASGSAKQPNLKDHWSINGTVAVTVAGAPTSTPFSYSDTGHEYTGANPVGVSFSGTATWTGTKVG